MTDEQLKQALVDHENFVTFAAKQAAHNADPENVPSPVEGAIADISNVNVEGKDLRYVNLKGATAASLQASRADLRGADFTSCELQNADLSRAALNNAVMISCNLRAANLSRADLRQANLEGSDLSNADLRFADLRGANLNNCNLIGTNLGSTGLLVFQFEQHPVYYMGGDQLNIGGTTMSIPEWQAGFVEAATNNGYTEQQIAMYSTFIEGLAKGLNKPPVPEEGVGEEGQETP